MHSLVIAFQRYAAAAHNVWKLYFVQLLLIKVADISLRWVNM